MNILKDKIRKCLKGIVYNEFYYWHIVGGKRKKSIRAELVQLYNGKNSHNSKCKPSVINIYDGGIRSGGLADRFRGIVSTYSICKEKGLTYKLNYTDPFPLCDFLVPNSYDWTVSGDEISYNLNNIDLVILDTTKESAFQKKKQEKYLRKKLSNASKQVHVYTNACFSYDKDYSSLFRELFKPGERLQKSIDNQLEKLGKTYISVSARFLNLLGDFNEPFGYDKPLPKEEAELLKEKVFSQIARLHEQFPDKTILVNSDSTEFLAYADKHEYTYVVPGKVTHIDNAGDEYSYEKYEKTFLDFYLIANAERIFLIKESRMFASGYPKAASKVYNKPYEVMEV